MTATTSRGYWQTAARVCTDKEFQALMLRDAAHAGTRLIALHLGISRAAVRERLDNADRKIAAARKDADANVPARP